MSYDLIDKVLSVTPGSHLDQLRRHREVARDNIQKAYDALFSPRDTQDVSLLERLAIASFVAGLHQQIVLADHYEHLLLGTEGGVALAALVNEEIERGSTEGPYGTYPAGPLAAENKQGPFYAVAPANRAKLGERLASALEHAHLLVYRLRDASREALHRLIDAGWTTGGVVTLSQLIAYLSFQTRIVEGLTVLAATNATAPRLPKVASASAIA